MTFAETDKLVKAIGHVETWSRALDREFKKAVTDFEQVETYQKWLDEAKQDIFEVASR
tara:strand:- start:1162 stop:1335 length:174 start_codon:yes stop_codon:yes gene_type:complete